MYKIINLNGIVTCNNNNIHNFHQLIQPHWRAMARLLTSYIKSEGNNCAVDMQDINMFLCSTLDYLLNSVTVLLKKYIARSKTLARLATDRLRKSASISPTCQSKIRCKFLDQFRLSSSRSRHWHLTSLGVLNCGAWSLHLSLINKSKYCCYTMQ